MMSAHASAVADRLRDWPLDRALAALVTPSAANAVRSAVHGQSAPRSFLGQPRVRLSCTGSIATGQLMWTRTQHDNSIALAMNLPHDPFEAIDLVLTSNEWLANGHGWWVILLHYELARWVEPGALSRARNTTGPDDKTIPLIDLLWCGDLEDTAENLPLRCGPGEHRFIHSPLESSTSPDEYMAAVERIRDYIAAGDIFQANITQRYQCQVTGNARELFIAGLDVSQAGYAAYIELDAERTVISLSPELFLDADFRSGHVVTRPIKGTRPRSAEAIELFESEKDAAELHMIVDLMRNDLGRVARFGSVKVVNPRTIETHSTVHHGVAEVQAILRPGISVGDLIKATFPAGSITGAPKVRAMQIINELESQLRGIYCGAIGCYIPSEGRLTLNVAIRTMMLERVRGRERISWAHLDNASLTYGAGGGIVTDSVPALELDECRQKVEVLRQALAQITSAEAPFR
ncbi:MAG: anthranilate synthase component I family protein [Phycisphaerales bacterium]